MCWTDGCVGLTFLCWTDGFWRLWGGLCWTEGPNEKNDQSNLIYLYVHREPSLYPFEQKIWPCSSVRAGQSVSKRSENTFKFLKKSNPENRIFTRIFYSYVFRKSEHAVWAYSDISVAGKIHRLLRPLSHLRSIQQWSRFRGERHQVTEPMS